MSLDEFEKLGGCEGCYFYEYVEGQKVCTFHWYDDESEDWEMGKNCDDMEGC